MLLAAFIFIILGGLDEFTGSYETLTGWLGIVPQGATAALAVTAVVQIAVGDLLQRDPGGGLPARARGLAARWRPSRMSR